MDTATRLFTEIGMESTSLRRIADELGVTKAALYYYFPSKRELTYAIASPVALGLEALVSRLETDSDITPQGVLEAYFDFTIEHLHLYQLLLRNPGIMVDLDLVPKFLECGRRFEVIVFGPDATAEQRVRATMAFGGVGDCALLLQDVPTDELRDATVKSACDVLRIEWRRTES